MKISDPNILLDYLENIYETWYVTRDKKKRSYIEDCVFQYIQNMDDDIYIEANDGRASGLCSYPYFETDLKKLINLLKSKL